MVWFPLVMLYVGFLCSSHADNVFDKNWLCIIKPACIINLKWMHVHMRTQYLKLLKLKQSQYAPLNLCTCGITWQHTYNMTLLPIHTFPHIDIELLICTHWCWVEPSMEMILYELRTLFHHCMLVTNQTTEKFFTRKHIKWVKNLLYHEILVLFRREFVLSGKCIEREAYMLIICEHFGTTLFWLHIQENVLSRNILTSFALCNPFIVCGKMDNSGKKVRESCSWSNGSNWSI